MWKRIALAVCFLFWCEWISKMPLEGQPLGQPSHPQSPADEKGTQSQSSQRGTKESPVFGDIGQHLQSESDVAKVEKDNKRKEFNDALVAWSAAGAAVFTGLLVIIGHRGVRAANRTLTAIQRQGELMEAGGNDTRELARQALRQSDLTQSQLELSHRPWVSADVTIGSGLTFDQRGCVLMLNVAIMNVGHSIAKHVGLWAEFVIRGLNDWRTIQEGLCNAVKQPNDAHDYGWLLFPGQGVTEPRAAIARPEDIARGIKEGHAKESSAISLHIIGCVDYQSTLDPTKHHQTRSLSENLSRSREQSERNRHIMFYAKVLPGLPF
jgi:hypothetical protein